MIRKQWHNNEANPFRQRTWQAFRCVNNKFSWHLYIYKYMTLPSVQFHVDSSSSCTFADMNPDYTCNPSPHPNPNPNPSPILHLCWHKETKTQSFSVDSSISSDEDGVACTAPHPPIRKKKQPTRKLQKVGLDSFRYRFLCLPSFPPSDGWTIFPFLPRLRQRGRIHHYGNSAFDLAGAKRRRQWPFRGLYRLTSTLGSVTPRR